MARRIYTIAAVVTTYWTVSTAMVLANKKLVNVGGSGAQISVFLVWIQNIIGAIILLTADIIARFFKVQRTGIQQVSLQKLMCKDVILASSSYTGMLVFNNLMLQHINVSFYQVARSMNIIFVLIFSNFILRDKILIKQVVPCVFIVLGFYLGVDTEIISKEARPLGVVYGVASSVMSALAGIYFKRLQTRIGTTSLHFTYYNFVVSTLTLTPVIVYMSKVNGEFPVSGALESDIWILVTLSGVLGLFMGWVSSLEISLTSPLTHIISTNAKSVFLTILAVIWNGESRGFSWWISNIFVVGGTLIYALCRLNNEIYYSRCKLRDIYIVGPIKHRRSVSSDTSRMLWK